MSERRTMEDQLGSEVQIRAVGGDEWERWREIRLRALLDAPDAYGSTYEREAAFTEADFRERLGVGGPAFLAMVDDQPVGMGAGYRYREGCLLVVAMWVDPAWRGRRIADRILDATVGWAREHGLQTHLYVQLENSAARRAYERYGFVPTGETTRLRPDSELVIELMRLPD